LNTEHFVEEVLLIASARIRIKKNALILRSLGGVYLGLAKKLEAG
jgi:hypothetical protein